MSKRSGELVSFPGSHVGIEHVFASEGARVFFFTETLKFLYFQARRAGMLEVPVESITLQCPLPSSSSFPLGMLQRLYWRVATSAGLGGGKVGKQEVALDGGGVSFNVSSVLESPFGKYPFLLSSWQFVKLPPYLGVDTTLLSAPLPCLVQFPTSWIWGFSVRQFWVL